MRKLFIIMLFFIMVFMFIDFIDNVSADTKNVTNKDEVTLEVTASDGPNGSGIRGVVFSTDDGDNWTNELLLVENTATEFVINLPDIQGEIVILTKIFDNATNESNIISIAVIRDITSPTGDVILKYVIEVTW